MVDTTRAPAFATPVFFAPAPGARTTNYTAAVAGNLIYTGAGYVSGLIINTGSAGSIELFDGDPGAGGVSLGKWSTATSGSFVTLGIPFATSLYATVVGTANSTLTYVPAS